MPRPAPSRPAPRVTARTRNVERWRVAGNVAFVVFGLALATAVYCAVTGTELVDSTSGRTLDCGSIIAPSSSDLAAANCGGVNDGNMVGLVIAGVVGLAALAFAIMRLVRENRGIHW